MQHFNSFGNTLLIRYIYKERLVKILANIAFLFYKEIYMKYLILYYIIILRVSFCSDIWYCNILAYYLDN